MAPPRGGGYAPRGTVQRGRDVGRRFEVGEVEARSGGAEDARGQVAAGGPDVLHLGPEVGHRAAPAQQLHLHGDRTVGHLGGEGGVQGPHHLARVAELLAHGPQGHCRDHAALGQGVEVPVRADGPLVAARPGRPHGGGGDEGVGHERRCSRRGSAVSTGSWPGHGNCQVFPGQHRNHFGYRHARAPTGRPRTGRSPVRSGVGR